MEGESGVGIEEMAVDEGCRKPLNAELIDCRELLYMTEQQPPVC